MIPASRFTLKILVLFIVHTVGVSLQNRSMAQFTGNYQIERHHLDMENFLDWKAYQPPVDWRYEWFFSQSGLQASVGSISMFEFYYLNEIRLTQQLGRLATFHYHQFEESFYAKEPIYQEIEFRIGEDYGVSLIGYPPHDKKYGHQGYALSYGHRYTRGNLRISSLNQYFLHNEKNEKNEKNPKNEDYRSTPDFNRLEALFFWGDQLFFHLDLKQVTKAELEEKVPAVIRTFYSNGGRLTLDWHASNNWLIGFSGFSNQEFREQLPAAVTQDLPDLEQKLILNWADLYFHSPYGESSTITIGALWSEFINRIDSSLEEHEYEAILNTSQAYAILQYAKSNWFHWRYSLQIGQVELNKEYIGIDETEDESNLEMKAGIGLILQEKERYRLFMNTTWDLDLITTRQWDGGNVQLQIVF